MEIKLIEERIQLILNRVHDNKEKRALLISEGRINFACPFCLDSDKNPRLKRGNLYLSNFHYLCYNGGCVVKRIKFTQFLKRFNERIDLDLYEEISEIENKKQLDSKEKINLKVLIPIERFKREMKCIDFGYFPKIDNIIKKRKLEPFKEMFKIDIKRNGFWILNIIQNKYLIGAQFRSLKENSVKYISYNWSQIANLLKIKIELDANTQDLLDKESLLFNLYNVNPNETITIVEGVIDSLFIPNSIATSGLYKVNQIFDLYDKENLRFLLDNDSDGIKQSQKLIKLGYSVFNWKSFIKDNNIESNPKDVNDVMIQNSNIQNDLINDKHFVDNLLDWNLLECEF